MHRARVPGVEGPGRERPFSIWENGFQAGGAVVPQLAARICCAAMHDSRARFPRPISWISLGLIAIAVGGSGGCSDSQPEPTKSFESAYQPQPPPPPPPLPEVGAAVRAALLVPDRLARVERLASLLRSLGPDAIEPVRQAYDTTFLDVGDVELTLFIE